MNSKIFAGFVFALFVVISEVSGRHCTGCGFGTGVDYCCQQGTYNVRPVPIRQTKTKSIRPIGDVCSCREIQVKPVSVPRPKCVYKEKRRPMSYDSRPLIPAPDYLHDFTQDEDTFDTAYLAERTDCGSRPLYPVDAVSISLVNRMQDSLAASLPEEKLQYGFYKIPKDVPAYRHIPNVPEEKLFTVERQIIELKNPKQIVKCNEGCDEEIVMEDKEMQPSAYLSYSDLGYVPEEASIPRFVTSCQRKGRPSKYVQQYEVQGSSEEDYKYKVNRGKCGSFVKKLKGSCGCSD